MKATLCILLTMMLLPQGAFGNNSLKEAQEDLEKLKQTIQSRAPVTSPSFEDLKNRLQEQRMQRENTLTKQQELRKKRTTPQVFSEQMQTQMANIKNLLQKASLPKLPESDSMRLNDQNDNEAEDVSDQDSAYKACLNKFKENLNNTQYSEDNKSDLNKLAEFACKNSPELAQSKAWDGFFKKLSVMSGKNEFFQSIKENPSQMLEMGKSNLENFQNKRKKLNKAVALYITDLGLGKQLTPDFKEKLDTFVQDSIVNAISKKDIEDINENDIDKSALDQIISPDKAINFNRWQKNLTHAVENDIQDSGILDDQDEASLQFIEDKANELVDQFSKKEAPFQSIKSASQTIMDMLFNAIEKKKSEIESQRMIKSFLEKNVQKSVEGVKKQEDAILARKKKIKEVPSNVKLPVSNVNPQISEGTKIEKISEELPLLQQEAISTQQWLEKNGENATEEKNLQKEINDSLKNPLIKELLEKKNSIEKLSKTKKSMALKMIENIKNTQKQLRDKIKQKEKPQKEINNQEEINKSSNDLFSNEEKNLLSSAQATLPIEQTTRESEVLQFSNILNKLKDQISKDQIIEKEGNEQEKIKNLLEKETDLARKKNLKQQLNLEGQQIKKKENIRIMLKEIEAYIEKLKTSDTQYYNNFKDSIKQNVDNIISNKKEIIKNENKLAELKENLAQMSEPISVQEVIPTNTSLENESKKPEENQEKANEEKIKEEEMQLANLDTKETISTKNTTGTDSIGLANFTSENEKN